MQRSTGTTDSQAFTPGPLRPEQVLYLVLEGGGGKGFAYLGALRALEEAKILQYGTHPKTKKPMLTGQIRGVGGASAGAITALLLSIGYSARELEAFMDPSVTNFDKFFDPPEPRQIPSIGSSIPVKDIPIEQYIAKKAFPDRNVIIPIVYREILRIRRQLLEAVSIKPPLSVIIAGFPSIVAYLWRDMGIFSGYYARQTFDEVLAERMGIDKKRKPPYNVTFKEHFEHFGIKLAVTGTNLETGTTELFTTSRYDDLPIADAIRISMGLPFIYKPYVIHGGGNALNSLMNGTWVDGGVWNNVPFRTFEQEPGVNPKTLALRLDIEERIRINDLGDFLKRWLNFAMFGSGETQISEPNAFQTISLDTTGLSLINFSPSAEAKRQAITKAYRKTREYFGG